MFCILFEHPIPQPADSSFRPKIIFTTYRFPNRQLYWFPKIRIYHQSTLSIQLHWFILIPKSAHTLHTWFPNQANQTNFQQLSTSSQTGVFLFFSFHCQIHIPSSAHSYAPLSSPEFQYESFKLFVPCVSHLRANHHSCFAFYLFTFFSSTFHSVYTSIHSSLKALPPVTLFRFTSPPTLKLSFTFEYAFQRISAILIQPAKWRRKIKSLFSTSFFNILHTFLLLLVAKCNGQLRTLNKLF